MSNTVSGVVYQCPGTTSYGRGLSETHVHGGGCCERFSALSVDEQGARGLRLPRRLVRPAARPHDALCFPDRPGSEHDIECECWCHEQGGDETRG